MRGAIAHYTFTERDLLDRSGSPSGAYGRVMASDLCRFVRVPYQTFASWMSVGSMGNENTKKVGHRNERSLGFADCLLARLLADLSPITRVKKFAFHADPTIMDLRGIVQRIIGLNPIPRWIQMWYDGEVLRLLPPGDSIAPEYVDVKVAAGRAVPFVIIPFRETYDEVARFVEKEAQE